MNNIEKYLKLRNFTQRKLAEDIGVSEATVGRYIKGTRNPSINVVARMASSLGCKTTDLYPDKMINSNNQYHLITKSSTCIENSQDESTINISISFSNFDNIDKRNEILLPLIKNINKFVQSEIDNLN